MGVIRLSVEIIFLASQCTYFDDALARPSHHHQIAVRVGFAGTCCHAFRILIVVTVKGMDEHKARHSLWETIVG